MKKNLYICITESLCHVAEINTTLSINYTAIKSLKIQKKKEEWINHRVLLYSTGYYNLYPVKIHNGKENENECICIYVCVCV